MTQPDHDIVIVGSALVGATLALALARFGYSVAVVDAQETGSSSPENTTEVTDSLDLRSTAVASATADILGLLGLWSEFGEGAGTISYIQVSQQGHFGTVRLSAEEESVPALGYVVNNDKCTGRLHAAIQANSNISVFAPATVEALDSDDESVTLTVMQPSLQQGDHINLTARLLLAVDGAHSTIRSLVSIPVTTTDYEQCAIITTVQTELSNQQTAYERFTPSGPLALLPVSSHHSSLVYTVDRKSVDTIIALDDTAFLLHLRQAFGSKLGRLERCGQRVVFPLVLTESARQSAQRVLLMGNAARTLHPVAGQGFNLAIRDVAKFLELVGRRETTDAAALSDPGRESLLQEFCSIRRADQRKTVLATDALARIFRGNSRWFSHLRATGLMGLDATPLLRSAFARSAMGRSVSLPDLPA